MTSEGAAWFWRYDRQQILDGLRAAVPRPSEIRISGLSAEHAALAAAHLDAHTILIGDPTCVDGSFVLEVQETWEDVAVSIVCEVVERQGGSLCCATASIRGVPHGFTFPSGTVVAGKSPTQFAKQARSRKWPVKGRMFFYQIGDARYRWGVVFIEEFNGGIASGIGVAFLAECTDEKEPPRSARDFVANPLVVAPQLWTLGAFESCGIYGQVLPDVLTYRIGVDQCIGTNGNPVECDEWSIDTGLSGVGYVDEHLCLAWGLPLVFHRLKSGKYRPLNGENVG